MESARLPTEMEWLGWDEGHEVNLSLAGYSRHHHHPDIIQLQLHVQCQHSLIITTKCMMIAEHTS